MGIKKALQIWNAKEVNILSEKETRVADMPAPDETRSIAKPRVTTSSRPAPEPKPQSKDQK